MALRDLEGVGFDLDTLRSGEHAFDRVSLHAGHGPGRAARRQVYLASGVAIVAAMVALGCSPAEMRGARRAMDEGDFEAAARHYRAAAEQAPDDAERWAGLARAEGLAERPAAARVAWLEVARLRPHDPTAWIEVGYTHELERHYPRALTAYGHAVRAAPDRAKGWRVRGTRLLRWGRAADAIPDLERALALNAASARTWQALGLARHASGDVEGAEQAFRDGLSHSPHNPRLLIGLAAILVNSHRFNHALAIYDELRSPRPEGASIEVGRALLLHQLGRRDEALAAFVLAVRLAPARAELRQRLRDYRRLLATGVDPARAPGQAAPHDPRQE